MIVAIHQPNYFPWLGYFHKIAAADCFVFLDDAQYSKGGYINRVKIASPGGHRWLTIPVRVHLGEPICSVFPASDRWVASHLDILRNMYNGAESFKHVWPDIQDILQNVPAGSLADINIYIVMALAKRLKLCCRFMKSSAMTLTATSDDRLIEILSNLSPGGEYLSGRGAAKYQDPEKFTAAGFGFKYMDFSHPEYTQWHRRAGEPFVTGLSILDAAFNMGWERTVELLEVPSQGRTA